MKCSVCKLEGYNKNNCPRCKEKNEERYNRILEILPFETAFVAITYFSLSQTIQKQGNVADFLGTAGDLLALKNAPSAGIYLGSMLSLAYEGHKEGWLDWLEKQVESTKGFYEIATDPTKSFGPYG